MRHAEVRNERFKAWVYTVINPVLEGLKIEEAFLGRRNWTFRFRSRELEYIRPVEEYVDFAGKPNLEDFLDSNAADRKSIASRDQDREALREKCQRAFDYLATHAGFREEVSSCVEQFGNGDELPSGDEFHNLVAERVVNNIQELPAHYGDARFWSRFRDRLMRFRKAGVFEQADRAGVQLLRSNERLSMMLRATRKRQAEEHDVPFAPYPESLAR